MKTPFTTEEYIRDKKLEVPHLGFYAALIGKELRRKGYVNRIANNHNGRRCRVWVKAGETASGRATNRILTVMRKGERNV